jgi:hypothetical protein
MSYSFSPMPCWMPSFDISDPSLTIPPLPTYHAHNGERCTHCDGHQHEENRCYSKDPRNMYRYPPNKGWPNGAIPELYIRMFCIPKAPRNPARSRWPLAPHRLINSLVNRPMRTEQPTPSPVAASSAYVPSPSLPLTSSPTIIPSSVTSSPPNLPIPIAPDHGSNVNPGSLAPPWFTSMELRFTSRSINPPFSSKLGLNTSPPPHSYLPLTRSAAAHLATIEATSALAAAEAAEADAVREAAEQLSDIALNDHPALAFLHNLPIRRM